MATSARTASGLRREFRTLDVFIFNALAYAIGVSIVITPPLLGNYPGANLPIALGLGFFGAICNGVTYGFMSGAMPRSGGDYVFITRTLGPWVGFTASFGFCFSQVYGIGLYTSQCVSNALGSSLSVLGYAYHIRNLTILGETLGTPAFNIIGGIFLLSTVYFLSVKKIQVLRRALQLLFFLAIMGVIAMAWVFWTIDHTEFVRRFNEFMNHTSSIKGAYEQVIRSAAGANTITGTEWKWGPTILALPIGYLVFVGFTYSVYIGGEVRKPEKSQMLGILGALFVGCVFLGLVLIRYYEIAGKEFIDALASGKYPVPLQGSLLLLANIMTDYALARAMMCVGFFLWYYLLLFVMTLTCVRILFAWSRDRLAPESFMRTNPNTASLYMATRVVLGAAVLGLLISAFTTSVFLNYIALFSVCFLIAGIGAFVYPIRRRSEFERAPAMVRSKLFGIPWLQLTGSVNTLLFATILICSFYKADRADISGGAVTPWHMTLVLAVYVVGYIWYYVATHKKDAIDPEIIYETLPADIVDEENDDGNIQK